MEERIRKMQGKLLLRAQGVIANVRQCYTTSSTNSNRVMLILVMELTSTKAYAAHQKKVFLIVDVLHNTGKSQKALRKEVGFEAMARRTVHFQSGQQGLGFGFLPNGAKVIGKLNVIQEQKGWRGEYFHKQSTAVAQVIDKKKGIDYERFLHAVQELNLSRRHGYKRAHDKTLFIKETKRDSILVYKSTEQERHLISQDEYVLRILKKFYVVHVKAAITPMETKLPLTKDEEAFDVDVTPKTSHLHVSRGLPSSTQEQTKLGIMESRESPWIWKHS
ncbi:hypothetical protein Tco_0806799 [Tanacetum coccineum]